MGVVRAQREDYGGVTAWTSEQPDQPVYLAPHLLAEYWSDGALTQAGIAYVENVVAERIAAVTLESTKAEKVAALEAWYAAQAAAGVSVGQITLPAGVEDQGRYTSLAAMEHLALTLGQRQLTDISGLADINGEWHTMALSSLFGVLLQYGAACAAWSSHYAEVLAQIHAATTIEEAEAITI